MAYIAPKQANAANVIMMRPLPTSRPSARTVDLNFSSTAAGSGFVMSVTATHATVVAIVPQRIFTHG